MVIFIIVLYTRYIYILKCRQFSRVFWVGVMSLVMSLCGLQIYQLYSNWLSSRTILTLDNNKYGIWDLPFPAITFCSDIQLQHIDNRTLGNDTFNK